METTMDVTPDEVLSVYRAGTIRGFMAGVIFCAAVKYLYDRRREIVPPEILDDIRKRN